MNQKRSPSLIIFFLFLVIAIHVPFINSESLNSPSINILKKLPTLIQVNYNVQGGDASSLSTQVFLNDTQLDTTSGTTDCNATDCTISSLTESQPYNITIFFTDNTSTINVSQIITTPSYLNQPIIKSNDIHTTWMVLNLTIQGGDPNQSNQINITSFDGKSSNITSQCVDNNTTHTCNITNLLDNTNQTILIQAINGDQMNSTIFNFKTFQSIQIQNVTFNIDGDNKLVYFNYSVTGGFGQTKITIDLGLYTDQDCQFSLTNCTVSYDTVDQGLNATAVLKFINDGQLFIYSIPMQLPWSRNNVISYTVNTLMATSFTVHQAYFGYVPLATFSVLIDGVLRPECNNSPTCVIRGLSAATTYVMSISVWDGMFNKTVLPNQGPMAVRTLPAINTPTLYPTLTTKSIKVDYSIQGGAVSQKKNYVIFDNNNATGCTQSTCTINNLSDGSTHNFTVVFYSEGYVVIATRILTTFKNISTPIITFTRGFETLNVNWLTMYGVPGASLYNVTFNGTAVATCTKITSGTCVFTNLIVGDTMEFRVDVFNDGIITSGTSSYYVIPPPTPISAVATPSLNSIRLDWTPSSDTQTSYSALISFDSFAWYKTCTSSTTYYCIFDNLPQNTTFYTKVQVISPGFIPNDTILIQSTLFSNETIECPKSCNGNGQCNKGICECNEGYTGYSCEWQSKNSLTSLGTSIPMYYPTIDFGNGEGYQFSFTSLVEVDPNGTAVASVNINYGTWQLITSNSVNITHPSNGSPVTQIRRVYILATNSPSNAQVDSISITFTQLQPIPGVTQGDDYPYSFAGENFSVAYGAVKFTMRVSKWNFASPDNILELHSDLFIAPQCLSTPISLSFDNNPNRSMTIINSPLLPQGRSIYSRFMNRVMVDSIPRVVSHRFSQYSGISGGSYYTKASIVTTFGNFRNQLLYDPDFASSKVASPLCKTPSTTTGIYPSTSGSLPSSSSTDDGTNRTNDGDERAWKITVGVVVGVVGTAVIATAIFILRQRAMLIRRRGKGSKQMKSNNYDLELKQFGN